MARRRKPGKAKQRVDFRRNRSRPARQKKWDVPAGDDTSSEDTVSRESVRAKGALSRRRTVIQDDPAAPGAEGNLKQGRVIAVRGQFVDVHDGDHVWPCTVRRILRTRKIRERHPVVVGDMVDFTVVADEQGQLNEGVIERVYERKTALTRADARRTHIIAANVDQVLIVTSIREPMIKPHLLDRYIVAAHAGGLEAIVCVNKVDLDPGEESDEIIDRYRDIGYTALKTSTISGVGIDHLRDLLRGRISTLAGQSGVGKSSLINAAYPGIELKTSAVSELTEKGRHTTTTAQWFSLDDTSAVIDTPGIRAFDVAMVPINELESHFVEFVDRIADCRFPDCSHTHEEGCAVKSAVETGEIDHSRYESYCILLDDLREMEFYETPKD